MSRKILYCDPSSGWKYGFPKPVPEGTSDMRKFLLDNGYPEKDVDFALKYMRYWYEESEDDTTSS